jgi:hypothetical protein
MRTMIDRSTARAAGLFARKKQPTGRVAIWPNHPRSDLSVDR